MLNEFYTKGEEIANAITHGIGALLSIAALVILIVFSAKYGDAWYVTSYSIFGSCLFILYLESTLYHSLQGSKVKKIFRIFDHSSIFLLIAGTYTPFILTSLRDPLGWTIFGIEWGLTLIGIILKVFTTGKYEKLSTAIYIFMGWLIMLHAKKLVLVIPRISLIYLIVGGVIYTVGAFLFMLDDIPYNHPIWHLFVIGGSIFHFFSLFYMIPR
ncbi:hemolysin III family protein [Clostridium botulinum]|nr:hemolysin III family protein [Clostridium botulinum]